SPRYMCTHHPSPPLFLPQTHTHTYARLLQELSDTLTQIHVHCHSISLIHTHTQTQTHTHTNPPPQPPPPHTHTHTHNPLPLRTPLNEEAINPITFLPLSLQQTRKKGVGV